MDFHFFCHNKTSKLSNFILHQFEGLHKLWDSPQLIFLPKKCKIKMSLTVAIAAKLSKGSISTPYLTVRLTWNQIEQRICALVKNDDTLFIL